LPDHSASDPRAPSPLEGYDWRLMQLIKRHPIWTFLIALVLVFIVMVLFAPFAIEPSA
jgi:hypothetical protein